ncbi:MAG: C40 family peptidase [Woeseiaceae bacterium]|nr:C40 family peptidase [Woeseiaceae bacterium]
MLSRRTTFARPVNRLLPAALLLGCVLQGCAGSPPLETTPDRNFPAPASSVPARSLNEQAAVIAVRQVGIPYRYGGAGRGGFDCSGLVHYAYTRAGKPIARTTARQWQSLAPVSRHELRTGDVLFFRIAGKMSHVGLYLGDGRFVHAPSTGREVTVAALEAPFYRQAFIRAGRP